MGGTMLVGVDGTVACRTAVGWAVDWARAHGQRVEMVHVVDDERGRLRSRALRDREEEAVALLSREVEVARADESGVEVGSRVLVGHPLSRWSEASRSAAGVVVGTHKTGYAGGRVFGSFGLRLASVTRSPLFVIPTDGRRQRRRVVVGVDDAEERSAAVEFAARAAFTAGHELVVLRAASGLHGVEDCRLLDRAAATARATAPSLAVHSRRSPVPAGESLAVASESAELTVVGRDTALALGAAGTDLLMNPGGPVAVIPLTITRPVAGSMR